VSAICWLCRPFAISCSTSSSLGDSDSNRWCCCSRSALRFLLGDCTISGSLGVCRFWVCKRISSWELRVWFIGNSPFSTFLIASTRSSLRACLRI
jgi:hypothetical protein